MRHNILTETAFFKVINNLGGKMELDQIREEYHQFVTRVIDLCHRTSESKEALYALVFAETELQYHPLLHPDTGCALGLYIKKALSFIRKMMQQVKVSAGKGASVAVAHEQTDKVLPICWTGNAVDLVEMVYGICVMGSVNDGEVKFKELAQAMYQFFGVKGKDCYRFYTDIRRRKNYSRTYFLDKMQEKLNDKMRRDDELERMRR